MKLRNFLLFSLILPAFLPALAKADYQDQRADFYVEKDFAASSSTQQVKASLKKIGSKAYFYVEDKWWRGLTSAEQQKASLDLNDLAGEFDSKIYKLLTAQFGLEWKPGIDNDNKITVLFHSMKDGYNGYFRSGDEYEKIDFPASNQREMVYLNVDYLSDPFAKALLAHEFTHLIGYNQKDRKYGVTEAAWLDEARAELAVTLLGYSNDYDQSYLRMRAMDFLEYPYDSLTEWQGQAYDYGVLNLFTHYLVEQYGAEVLSGSLRSSRVGTDSINQYLKDHFKGLTLNQAFSDWSVAVLRNDCSLGEKYCYKNQGLKNIKLVPFNNFMPFSGESTINLRQNMTEWSCHWQKFTGGRDGLKIDFKPASLSASFKVRYVIEDNEGKLSLGDLNLDKNGQGQLVIPDFSKNNKSITVILCLEKSPSNMANERSYAYYLSASTLNEAPTGEPQINLPFKIDKPISEMSREEILIVIIRMILYLRGATI